MGCKFSGAKVGDSVSFHYSDWTCDECGNVEQDQDYVTGTYMGHEANKRYGVCDHIRRDVPAKCQSCGAVFMDIYLPCGNQSHGLFRESVVVERNRTGGVNITGNNIYISGDVEGRSKSH